MVAYTNSLLASTVTHFSLFKESELFKGEYLDKYKPTQYAQLSG